VRLTREEGIETKEKEFRDKFIVIIGMDANCYYGVLLINTRPGIPETEQYELKPSAYRFLHHNSFVNCSVIKRVTPDKIGSGTSRGRVLDDDLELIMDCVRASRVVSRKEKIRYGLIR
jgi:hypothetical protein